MTATPNTPLRDAIAARMYTGWVCEHGFPNGLPTWDELPEDSQARTENGRGIAADPVCKLTWRGIAEFVEPLLDVRESADPEFTELLNQTGLRKITFGGKTYVEESSVPEWRPIEEAKHDGTPYLVKFRFPESYRHGGWVGRECCAVLRARGKNQEQHDILGWSFAAPVGFGGIPDSWCSGFQEIDWVWDDEPQDAGDG